MDVAMGGGIFSPAEMEVSSSSMVVFSALIEYIS